MPQYYCSISEILADLTLDGIRDEAKLMQFVRSASQVISRRGHLIPTTEQRKYDGNGETDLWIDELLAITAFSLLDGDTVYTLTSADYLLHPANRWWEHGPYTRLEVDADSTQIGTWIKGQQNVQITGHWGLYEETRATAVTVASQDISSTSLAVSNGAGISPGMLLLIGTEQEAVEATGAASDSATNMSEALDNSEEDVDVVSAAVLNVGEIIKIDFEQMKVLDIVSNTLLVARGYNGTKRTTHLTNADVYVYRTFTVTRAANGTTAAIHTTADISRYIAPDEVNYLARQIAGLMLKKSQSGWAGKVGNAETGETFYQNEFPRDPIKEIMSHYTVVR